MSVELLSNLTKTRHTVPRLNQVTIDVVGRNNLTGFETTRIGSVLVKEIRPPTSSRLARLALVSHSCNDISVHHVYQIALSTIMKVNKKKIISCSLLFSEQPILDLKI